MQQRIAVLVRVNPYPDRASSSLQVQDIDAMCPVPLPRRSFVLSLGIEPGEETSTYAQGYIRSLDDGAIYPFRSNRSLFDALSAWLAGSGDGES